MSNNRSAPQFESAAKQAASTPRFSLPMGLKTKVVTLANLSFFSLRWTFNALWVAGTMAFLCFTPLIKTLEFERNLQQEQKQQEKNGSNITNSLPTLNE
ncbi:hypothetical protein DFA_11672 [Cavenderia fasciculata]|uniref:Uncharacterized protein n=1 Tax=Cavenderia fasciculata TaxID=261658 RepID=F4QDW4_CACFS|nr:uncharacterized protein DFA_11672 [Cavenderia fasciculata]EGG13911.1 hypothetical protein DFA_11672 [Cavenderia fasciculata]|eukprot:XP_004350619.1 hypothetical protein DFA_11672 [Cavenderia fasciculata]